MIQPLVFNKESHKPIKKAKIGYFRVQDDFSGNFNNFSTENKEILFSENTVKSCPELPIYTRVDIFTDNEGNIALSELELIEPELWFRYYPEAANVLSRAINERLTHEN